MSTRARSNSAGAQPDLSMARRARSITGTFVATSTGESQLTPRNRDAALAHFRMVDLKVVQQHASRVAAESSDDDDDGSYTGSSTSTASSSSSSSSEADEPAPALSPKTEMIRPQPNHDRAVHDAHVIAVERADALERELQAKARRGRSMTFENDETSDSNSNPLARVSNSTLDPDTERIDEESNTLPRVEAITRVMRSREQLAIVQQFLNAGDCDYSQTKLYNCVWNGLGDALREQVWIVLAATPESLSAKDFDTILAEACIPKKTYDQIARDLYRTGVPSTYANINALYRGLIVHAALRPDIGYVQGMNFIWARIIASVANHQQQLLVAEHLVNKVLPYYFTTDLLGAAMDARVLDAYLKRRCPNLRDLLDKKFEGIRPVLLRFTSTYFSTLFVNQLSTTEAKRLWDLIMLRGAAEMFEFMIRTLLFAHRLRWLEQSKTWIDFVMRLEVELPKLKSITCILEMHIPNGHLQLDDLVTRRASAARLIFADVARRRTTSSSTALIDIGDDD